MMSVRGAEDRLVPSELLGRISAQVEQQGIAGLVVTVVKGDEHEGQVRWSEQIETWGARNAAGDPFEKETIFAIGSISKFHAVLCIGLLISRGVKTPNGKLLSWTTRVKEVLPWWGVQAYREEGEDFGTDNGPDYATLEDLSGMRTGLPIHLAARRYDDPEAVLRRQRYLRPVSRLREHSFYNNESIYALAQIVTVLSGQEYPDFLQEHLFGALGMSSSSSFSTRVLATNRTADGFLRRPVPIEAPDGQTKYKPGPPESIGWWTEGEGKYLYSGAISYSAVDSIIMSKELLDPKVLPSAAVGEIYRPLSLIPPNSIIPLGLSPSAGPPGRNKLARPRLAYGGGMMHLDYPTGHIIATHSGGQLGQTALFVLVPEVKVGLWVAVNEMSGPASALAHAACLSVLDHLLGLSGVDRFTPQPQPGPSPSPSPLPEMKITLPPIPVDQLLGVYYDPGYLSITIKRLTDARPEVQRAVESALLAAGSAIPGPAVARLIIELPDNLFIHTILLEHELGPVYRWTNFSLKSVLEQGRDPIAVVRGRSGRAVFVGSGRKGVGFFDGFWDLLPTKSIAAREDNVQRRAEVWFDKIS